MEQSLIQLIQKYCRSPDMVGKLEIKLPELTSLWQLGAIVSSLSEA